jgi:hypothetical protein
METFMTQCHGHTYLNLWQGICIANNRNIESGLAILIAAVTCRMVCWSMMLDDEVKRTQDMAFDN